MNKLVQRSLHKSGINCTEWFQSCNNNDDSSVVSSDDNHIEDVDEGSDNG